MDLKSLLLPADTEEGTAQPAPRPVVGAVAGLQRRSGAGAEEALLIARCRDGDRAAMRVFYERYYQRVYGLAARIAGPQEAEELTQEVFLKALRSLGNFRGDAQLWTWLYRLTANAAISHVTRSPKRRHVSDEALGELAAPATPDGDPHMRFRLEAALERLPRGYRAVLVLHDIEGLEHEEIAAVLGCSVGTSKSQLHKARARMRELLGPALAKERAAHERGMP